MEPESKNLIDERVKKLPPEVRDALASDELHVSIEKIGQKHRLHIDQVGVLEDEVVMVMMGFVNPSELAGELVKQTSIEAKQAEEIASDVSQEIFLPIRAAMQKFMEAENKETSVVMPSAANAAAVPTPLNPASVPVPPMLVPPAPASISKAASPTSAVAKPLEMHAADLMLSEPTVSMPPKPASTAPASSTPAPATPVSPAPAVKVEAPKPAPYKADPYREPPE